MIDTACPAEVSSVQKIGNSPAFKRLAYKIDCTKGAMVYGSAGVERPLSECNIDDVDFIGGMWRIQNKFEHKIQFVRDKEFVLMGRINRTESNLFEFWRARLVGRNCYGRYLVGGDNLAENSEYDCVVAKYDTDKETFWAYGNTISEARAFLGIALYDKYQDLIHAAACKNKNKQK